MKDQLVCSSVFYFFYVLFKKSAKLPPFSFSVTYQVLNFAMLAILPTPSVVKLWIDNLQAVVISKNFNKGGSRHNHLHSLGVMQLQPRPYFQRWKHDNLV